MISPPKALRRLAGPGRTLALVLLLPLLSPVAAAPQLDDHRVTLASPPAVAQARRTLIGFVWGADGFPASRLPRVTRGVASPLPGLPNLARVDELATGVGAGGEGLAYHFIPARANGRLVIVHNGHTCTLDGLGVEAVIAALLEARYAVLAVFMPRIRPGDCQARPHDGLVLDPRNTPPAGSPLRYFLEPVAAAVNYARARPRVDGFPLYREIDMVGLSGGGWTTTVYAAIDPRIRVSVQVAGSIPLYSRVGGSVGDAEQLVEAFYRIAGYPDLYLMGAAEPGRRQLWVLNRRDDCCFGERADLFGDPAGRSWEAAMRDYEAAVSAGLRSLGPAGSFRLWIDDEAPSHMISPSTVREILAELERGRRARP